MAFRGVYLVGRSQGCITLRFYNKQAGGPGNSTKFSTFNKNYRQKVWDEWFTVNNFKGGKGIATFLGIILALSFNFAIIFGIVWFLIFIFSKYSSLSSIISTFSVFI